MDAFKKLGLSDDTLKALEKKGYDTPTEIQEKTIPLLLEGTLDVIGQSQTGTGKTASFALPIIEYLTHQRYVQAIILTPTRELAIQVATEIDDLKGKKKLKTLTVYGGTNIQTQLKQLHYGVDIVVGTPGRVLDLMQRGDLDIRDVSFAVLDEADEMLNMGFLEDMKKILSQTPKDKRMLLFSATMPKEILNIAKTFMREYVTVKVKKQQLTIDLTDQMYYEVPAHERFDALRRVVDAHPDFHGIIFCKTKRTADLLARKLNQAKYHAAALHGDISQAGREKILLDFKNKKVDLLIATDVAARGIHVNDLSHVVNYSLPQNPETYVHRIGRTGRAGKRGVAITFVAHHEKRELRFIEKIAKCTLEKKSLPTVDEIKSSREGQMQTKIEEMMKKTTDKTDAFANELLQKYEPDKIISALLNEIIKEEKPADYAEPGKHGSRGRGERSSRGGYSRGGNSRDRGGRSGGRSGGQSYSRGRSGAGRSSGRSGSGRSSGNRSSSGRRPSGGRSRR